MDAWGLPVEETPFDYAKLPETSGVVPPYEERVKWLTESAAILLEELRKRSHDWAIYEQNGQRVVRTLHGDVLRWLGNYELHTCQIDFPGNRPLGPPQTIDGEVKDE